MCLHRKREGGGGQEEEESKNLKSHNSHPQGVFGSVHLLSHLWITLAVLSLNVPQASLGFF